MKIAFLVWLAATFPSVYYAPRLEVRNRFGHAWYHCTNGGVLRTRVVKGVGEIYCGAGKPGRKHADR
jgi:hypothetical protein